MTDYRYRPGVTVVPSQDDLADMSEYRAYVEGGFSEEGRDMRAVRRHQRWMAEGSIDKSAGAAFDEQLARFTGESSRPSRG